MWNEQSACRDSRVVEIETVSFRWLCRPNRYRPSRIGLWIAFASITSVAGVGWSQRPNDTIQLHEGSPIRGKIIRTNPNAIEVETSAGPRTVPVDDIKEVHFGEEPPALRSARDAVLDGRWEQAVLSLDRVKPDQLQDALTRQEYAFYRAYAQGRLALERGSEESDAVRLLRAFATENRESWHTYQAVELLGDLAQKLGRLDHARSFYGQLANAESEGTRMRGSLLVAESLRRQGPEDYPQAIDQYNTVLAMQGADPAAIRVKQMALIGKARCGTDDDQLPESISTLEGIIAENDASDTELFGRAYVALGALHLREENLEDAVLALLKVDLLFHQDPEAHAEALYHLTKVWPLLGKPDRAAEARGRLQSQYGGSTWAQRP